MKDIYNERGIKGFYYGFGIGLIRVLPNNAVLFLSYEFISRYLQSFLVDYNEKSNNILKI